MKITQYLNQTAQFEEFVSEDEWGKRTYDAPITIRVRFQTKTKLMRTKDNHQFVTITEYMTEQPLKSGDRIDGMLLEAVEWIQDFKKTIGYKGYPEAPSSFGS